MGSALRAMKSSTSKPLAYLALVNGGRGTRTCLPLMKMVMNFRLRSRRARFSEVVRLRFDKGPLCFTLLMFQMLRGERRGVSPSVQHLVPPRSSQPLVQTATNDSRVIMCFQTHPMILRNR